ncbi:threonine synthase [compost metagenome]
MDPHTATCIKAYEQLKEKPIPMVICSTAEWTKFAPTMLMAIKKSSEKRSDLEALQRISEKLHIEITPSVKALFEKPIVHKDVVDKGDIEAKILQFIQS